MGRTRDIAAILGATEASNSSNVALLNTNSSVGLDSAQVSAIGVPTYDSIGALPLTGLSAGDQAFVSSNSRLYFSNGSGWYSQSIVNADPRWADSIGSGVGEPAGTLTISDSATPLIVKAVGADSDGLPLTNSITLADSAQYVFDMTQDSSVFTFTPKTKAQAIAASVAGNIDSNGASIDVTFKVTDGISILSKPSIVKYDWILLGMEFTISRSVFVRTGEAQSAMSSQWSSIRTAAGTSTYDNFLTGSGAQPFALFDGYYTMEFATNTNLTVEMAGGSGGVANNTVSGNRGWGRRLVYGWTIPSGTKLLFGIGSQGQDKFGGGSCGSAAGMSFIAKYNAGHANSSINSYTPMAIAAGGSALSNYTSVTSVYAQAPAIADTGAITTRTQAAGVPSRAAVNSASGRFSQGSGGSGWNTEPTNQSGSHSNLPGIITNGLYGQDTGYLDGGFGGGGGMHDTGNNYAPGGGGYWGGFEVGSTAASGAHNQYGYYDGIGATSGGSAVEGASPRFGPYSMVDAAGFTTLQSVVESTSESFTSGNSYGGKMKFTFAQA